MGETLTPLAEALLPLTGIATTMLIYSAFAMYSAFTRVPPPQPGLVGRTQKYLYRAMTLMCPVWFISIFCFYILYGSEQFPAASSALMWGAGITAVGNSLVLAITRSSWDKPETIEATDQPQDQLPL